MDLILAVICGAGAIVGAAVAKVIADDAKEWTPWVTRHLLDIAIRRLPESKRERYAEEWAAHLAEVPGVIGKLAVSLQFQIAAFGARELDAKARLDAWRQELAAIMAGIRTILVEMRALTGGRKLTNADMDTLKKNYVLLKDVMLLRNTLIEALRRYDELEARQPALGITVAGAIFMAERSGDLASEKVRAIAAKMRNWSMSVRDGIFGMLRRLGE